MRAFTRKTAWIAGSVIVVDQATKTLVRVLLPLCEREGTPSCDPIGSGALRFVRFPKGQCPRVRTGPGFLDPCGARRDRPHLLLRHPSPRNAHPRRRRLQLAGAVSNLMDRIVLE